MTPLYPDGVYAPLPRFSKKTQTNIAPSATRNTASARCSRDAPIISAAWSSKGSLLFPCFGEPSPPYSPQQRRTERAPRPDETESGPDAARRTLRYPRRDDHGAGALPRAPRPYLRLDG